jgi:hypothetical protein
MSNTTPRDSVGAAQMLADALLRTLSGTSAQLRITGTNQDTNMSELGLVSTAFAEVSISPVAMRKLRPTWQNGSQSKWELLVSATSIQQQVMALNLSSAQSLFAMTLAITIAEQDYLLEAVASNEAFGQVYLYRLLLREMQQQAL